jgi:hypothetical protein
VTFWFEKRPFLLNMRLEAGDEKIEGDIVQHVLNAKVDEVHEDLGTDGDGKGHESGDRSVVHLFDSLLHGSLHCPEVSSGVNLELDQHVQLKDAKILKKMMASRKLDLKSH